MTCISLISIQSSDAESNYTLKRTAVPRATEGSERAKEAPKGPTQCFWPSFCQGANEVSDRSKRSLFVAGRDTPPRRLQRDVQVRYEFLRLRAFLLVVL